MQPNPKPETDFPWWLVILGVIGALLFWQVWTSDVYSAALGKLAQGAVITVIVAVVAYGSACLMGLGLALMGMSRFILLRQIARFYVEVMRGVPIIVLLLYVAFVLAPALIVAVNWVTSWVGIEPWKTRDFPLIARATIALMLAYSAFLAEIFRAGLQAVDLTPEALAMITDLRSTLRPGPQAGLARMQILRRWRIHRQTGFGTMLLYLAALLGRV